MARAMEGEQLTQARAEMTASWAGPLKTMATRERVDPIKVIRPGYAGPQAAPAWWTATEEEDDDALMSSLMT